MIIKELYKQLVPGLVLPPSWFIDEGVSYQLLDKYVDSGWLVRVSEKGGYTTVHDQPSLLGLCAGLESVAPSIYHLSGAHALVANGLLSSTSLNPLISSKNKVIPKWSKDLSRYGISIDRMTKNCIYDFVLEIETKHYPLSTFSYRCSSNERAIVELLSTCESSSSNYVKETFRIFEEVFPSLNTVKLQAVIDNTSSQVALRLLKHLTQSKEINLAIKCRNNKPIEIVANGCLTRPCNLYL